MVAHRPCLWGELTQCLLEGISLRTLASLFRYYTVK